MKKRIAVAAVLLLALVAVAGPIKTWQAGEIITANDLNANFQHIHNLMVGGHGARLRNSDVSASAGISHSKLATPGLIAKSVFQVGTGSTACSAGTCSQNNTAGAAVTVAYVSPGIYTVTWTAARANANYVPVITPQYCGGSIGCACTVQTGVSTTAFTVACVAMTAVPAIASTNSVFGVVVYDNES